MFNPSKLSFKELLDKVQNNKEQAFYLNLERLDDPLTSEQAEMFAKALNANRYIKTLSVNGLPLKVRGRKMEEKGIIAIAKMLETNETITEINFWGGEIPPQENIAIAQALELNKCIIRCEFQGTIFDDASCSALARMLTVNQTLQYLRLNHNDLSGERGVAIAKALEKNRGLQNIDLEGTKLSNEAGLALANALRVNQTLETVKLDHTGFDKEIDIAIAKALAVHKPSMYFMHRTCGVTDEAAATFIEALKINRFLEVNLRTNFFSRTLEDTIEKLGKQNEKLMSIQTDIRKLFPDAQLTDKDLESKETAEGEAAEEFDTKRSEAILARINGLSSSDVPPSLIKDLQDYLRIASCSWDNYDNFDNKLGYLMDIINRNPNMKEKALSCVAQIYITRGMEHINADRQDEAGKCFRLAFTAARHGEDTPMKDEMLYQTVSLLFDKLPPAENIRNLLQNLLRAHPDRYKALENGYQNGCKVFNLIAESFDALTKVVTFSKESRGDSKSAAEASAGESKSRAEEFRGDTKSKTEESRIPGKDSAKASHPLSLDEDETSAEAEADKRKQKPK